MKDLLVYVLKNITTIPDDVVVEEHDEDGVTSYTVTVNPADVGRIIGKEGKVIKAIRTIMRVVAIQKGVRVRVSVVSDSETGGSTEEMPIVEEEVPMQVASPEVVEEATAPVASAPEVTELEEDGSISVEV